MRLDPSAFRPGIGVVVVADISDQQAVAGLVNDQADFAIDARRPKIGVLAVVDTVQLETVAGRVHLEIEDTRFHRFLVQARQAVEGSCEGVGDQKVHLFLLPFAGNNLGGNKLPFRQSAGNRILITNKQRHQGVTHVGMSIQQLQSLLGVLDF